MPRYKVEDLYDAVAVHGEKQNVPDEEFAALKVYVDELKEKDKERHRIALAKEQVAEAKAKERHLAKLKKVKAGAPIPLRHKDFYPPDDADWVALEAYVDEYYVDINRGLRGYGKLDDVNQEWIRSLDDMMAKQPVTKGPTTLYRGQFRNPGAFKVGEVVTDGAYSSTSDRKAAAKQFGTHMLQINVPAGTPLLAMPEGFGAAGAEMGEKQNEFVLPRGAQFRVDKIVEGGSVVVVHVTLTGFKPHKDLNNIPAQKEDPYRDIFKAQKGDR